MAAKSTYALRILLIIPLLSICITTMAQSIQQQKTDSVFQLVKKEFNARSVESLYALTGDAFKKQLDLPTFRNFCEIRFFPLGNMVDASLISFVNNKTATYKVVFSYITLQLFLSIDESDKIDYFLFQPLDNPPANKSNAVASTNPLKTLTDKEVDTAARAYIQKINTVGLSIGVFKDGKVTTYGYGETTRGNGKIPTPNTIFEIGSITKTFTATLLAWYVNQGKISLTDPITRFLPDSVAANPALQAIKLVNLSNHTSGLPSLPSDFFKHAADTLNPYKDYDQKLLYGYLKNCTLNSKPGETYAYSNMAVALLGSILEQISGKSYDEMVAEIITRPLQMNSTVEHLTPLLMQRFVTVYGEDGKATPAWNMNVFAPAGGLRSTVNNLMVYARANMIGGDSELAKAFELTHQITFSKDVKVGLNWHISTVNGVDYYFHNGGTYGSTSFLAFNAEKNIAVVVLSNCGASVDGVGVSILKRLQ